VLQAVCRHIAAWRAAGLAVCPISLNLSASQLLQSGFSEDVLQILESHDLHPSVLEFELTEMAAMTDFDTVAEKAVRLARAGVTFAIDDFGSGSSSLARLHRLPLTALKIDRAFVQKIEDSDGTYTLMEAAIQMAHSLKLRAVAKGVERPEQLALLRALGCELFQGFLLARPMLPSAITKILAPSGAPALSAAS
jgi:EAL domain-containing protein (putative c-di-GMP-specific phosphodiesterase class I)